MRSGAVLGAVLASAALLVSPVAPAHAADSPGEPAAARTGTLAGGATFLVRPVGGAPVAAIALWFRAPSAGFGEAPALGLGRLAAATVAASQMVTGTALVTFIERFGGRLVVTAYPESVAVSALVPADRAAATVQALTRAYFAPVLTDAGLLAAKRDQVSDAELHALTPESAIEEALYGSLFAAGPAKYPTFGAPTAIAGLTADQVRAFAERAFRPSNAFLVATGAVGEDVLADALPGREGAPAGVERPAPERVVPAPEPIRRAGDAGFGLAWAGPPIAEEREATALDFVADYLFAPDTGAIQRAAAASGASIAGTFVTFHDPGVFIVTVTGGDVAAARAAVEAALTAMQRPLAPAAFAAARRGFIYHILSDQQTPSGLADTYGWYAVEGNPAYAPGEGGARGRYLATAAALTPELIAATVSKYLGKKGASVTVTPAPARPRTPS